MYDMYINTLKYGYDKVWMLNVWFDFDFFNCSELREKNIIGHKFILGQ